MASLMTVTLELSVEDRERIDRLLAALERRAPATVTMETLKGLAQPEKNPAAETETRPEPEKVQPEPTTPEHAPEKSAPAVTAEEIQAKVVELISRGKKPEVKAIVVKYAPRVGAIPEDKRAEVLAELLKLEG